LLISLSSIDFPLLWKKTSVEIFSLFHEFKLKVNLIQNTAISFSVCVEDKFDNFNELNAILSKKFKVDFSQNVTLYTIRHLNDSAATQTENVKSDFKQISTETMQIVTSEN
jgi:aspartate kinase